MGDVTVNLRVASELDGRLTRSKVPIDQCIQDMEQGRDTKQCFAKSAPQCFAGATAQGFC